MKFVILLIRHLGVLYGRLVPFHITAIWYLFLEGINLGRLMSCIGKLGENPKISSSASFSNVGQLFIGNNVEIGGYCLFEFPQNSSIINELTPSSGSIKIGDNCSFGEYTHVTCVNSIIIGDNLLTGRNCLITDHSHGINDDSDCVLAPVDRSLFSKGSINIGNNVWLGDKVAVLSGVTIGDGTVVAANAVVTHDLPPYVIAAGVPARIIKRIR